MSFLDAIVLFGIMLGLSVLPSASVMLVVGRTACLGLANGIAVSIGIVLGDLVFIALVILGLAFVAETMGALFMVIKYLGAAYLIFLGVTLLRSNSHKRINVSEHTHQGNLIKSLLAGFFLTLGDVKAIVFYVSLFPVFLDLNALSVFDISVIALITIIAVGGVKVFYAISARKIIVLASAKRHEVTMNQMTVNQTIIDRMTGALMLAAGGFLITKA